MDIQKTEIDAFLASAEWNEAKREAARRDEGDLAAGLGRWWYQRASGQLVLSAVAAGFLGVGSEATVDACLESVEPDDRPTVAAALAGIGAGEAGSGCEFRVRRAGQGLRCLRLQPVGAAGGRRVAAGILVDITAARHAAARERFNFALTQYLVGSDRIDEAVVSILQLVCEELGWEWGAYWAVEHPADGPPLLRCRHSWHAPGLALAPFQSASASIALGPEQGLVGEVWASTEARWIEDAGSNPDLVRGDAARACGLQSAYFFPVTFVGTDGRLLKPGVLEFFSKLQRQPDAQLPGLAKSISAMIARAVERMSQQERIRLRAQTDELTGLANRSHFHEQLEQRCAGAAGRPFGVLFVDLDQFKPINDAFGHEAGNVVLAEFARRLRALAPPGWQLGRLGGDEFALLSAAGAGLEDIERVAAMVLEAARRRFAYREQRLAVSASIGISTYPAHGTSTRDLLHAADAAMYESKRSGRNLVSLYRGDGNAERASTARQLDLVSDLHCAIGRREFFLEYQPICDSGDARVVAVEALIRWRRADGSVVPPQVFIPLAEQSRLVCDIGRWVLRQVCRDLPRLQRAAGAGLRVHVNMAAPEFIDAALPQELSAIVAAGGAEPHHICLELTEGVVMQHAETAIPVMRELRRLGFGIGLDDFGMGYSSLSLLKKLPIGSIKIDRLFTAGVPHDRDDCAIVRSILDLGRHMQLQVIAEGVENDAQLGVLRQFGCPLVQGYLVGRPLSLEALAAPIDRTLSGMRPAPT